MSFNLIIEGLYSKVSPEPNTGCWLWLGRTHINGYGKICFRHSDVNAHRVFYILAKGEIVPSLRLHHKCETKLCVNPDHLELTTESEHILKPDSCAGINKAKTHCKQGHEFTPENTRYKFDGSRNCRACQAISNAKRYN